MGIIIKQSIKGSIWSYLALIVGYVNVGIIMPNYFQPDEIGLVQLFAALTVIFTNFSTLGFTSVINRMFPEFRDKKNKHNGFLFLTLATGLLGFTLTVIAFFIFKPQVVEANIQKSPLLVEYILLLIPLFFFRILFRLLDNYNKILYDAVTGTFWNEFMHKTINLVLVTLFAFHLIDFRQFFYSYVISLSLPAIPLMIVLIQRKEFNLKPDFKFLTRPLAREMVIVSAFGIINGLSGVLTNNVDKLLINKFLSLEQVGIFSVCALFATVIMIPSRATAKISTGIIAQAWKKNNTNHIQEIYFKASLTQTVLGSLLLAGILVNLDNIFTILPEVYKQGKWVLIIYSLGMLVRISTTTSGTIIQTSKYYKVLSAIISSQIIITLILHFILIPIYGITGAAISVFLTYFLRTIAVVGFIKIKMKMFCYSWKHFWVLIIAAIAFGVGYLVPETESLILNILFKSFGVSIIYLTLITVLKISPDINQVIINVLKKLPTFKNSIK